MISSHWRTCRREVWCSGYSELLKIGIFLYLTVSARCSLPFGGRASAVPALIFASHGSTDAAFFVDAWGCPVGAVLFTWESHPERAVAKDSRICKSTYIQLETPIMLLTPVLDIRWCLL